MVRPEFTQDGSPRPRRQINDEMQVRFCILRDAICRHLGSEWSSWSHWVAVAKRHSPKALPRTAKNQFDQWRTGNRGALTIGAKRALLRVVKDVLALWAVSTKRPEDAEPDFTIRWLEQGAIPYRARVNHRKDKAFNRAFQAAQTKTLLGVDAVSPRGRGRPRKQSPVLAGFTGMVKAFGGLTACRTWWCFEGEIVTSIDSRPGPSYDGRHDYPAWHRRHATAKWLDVYDGSQEGSIAIYRKVRQHAERKALHVD